jgi:hypothetical protein
VIANITKEHVATTFRVEGNVVIYVSKEPSASIIREYSYCPPKFRDTRMKLHIFITGTAAAYIFIARGNLKPCNVYSIMVHAFNST